MDENSKLRLPKLIGDGMVLQRDTKVNLWGYADPGDTLSLSFLNHTYTAAADKKGKWTISLEHLEPGGPYDLQVASESQTITLHNIYIGDVWIASGQSNMQLTIDRIYDTFRDELYQVNHPYIHEFKVPMSYHFDSPQEDFIDGAWYEATTENIMDFSAVAYFFARDLYEQYNIPIGIICSAQGGSPIESWLSSDSLRKFPDHMQTVSLYRDKNYLQKIVKKNIERMDRWYHTLYSEDVGLSGPGPAWYSKELDDSDWSIMTLPGNFFDSGADNFCGVIWLRKEFHVPASMAGNTARLWLGTIVDADETYINGIKVGETGYEYPPRKYEVPAELLNKGTNLITIRVISDKGKGGFTREKIYRLFLDKDKTQPPKVLTYLKNNEETPDSSFDAEIGIDLTGTWKYKVSLRTEPKPPFTFIERGPTGLYNAMIAPLLPFSIKGVIWYQGESNDKDPERYEKALRSLITDWRKKWGMGDFPFLFAQLPNFMVKSEDVKMSKWPLIREAQANTLTIPHTAMAVLYDVGEWNDLHPQNKKAVGHRLALASRKIAYHEDLVYSGPIYDSLTVEGNKLRVTFLHTGSGLTSRNNEPLHSFMIAGPGGNFVVAQAMIEGNHVTVWNDHIQTPAAVRYAWEDSPEEANLYNKEGLPASPFRAHL